MKLVSIVGARPQFIKLGPLCRAIGEHNRSASAKVDHVIVHTGQHYDEAMSGTFFGELQIPRPQFHLDVGSGSHGQQTGRMLEKLDPLLRELAPTLVTVFGDTNSTLAGALAAAKLQQRLVHVEAGLRSFNRQMPEEINRVATDHVCDLLFAPTRTAMENLARENLAARAVFTGDIMYDAVLQHVELAKSQSKMTDMLRLTPYEYGVVTIHRAQNTEVRELGRLLEAINQVATEHLPLVFPVHPRTMHRLRRDLVGWKPVPEVRLHEPLGYLDMLCLVSQARLVLTDSGGLQKEAFFLDCPCVTLREETEWPETVTGGGNVLVGCDPVAVANAVAAWQDRLDEQQADFSACARRSFGDGDAAARMLSSMFAFAAKMASCL
jgi:UDP-N-acetylglucosamine 2-epimerase